MTVGEKNPPCFCVVGFRKSFEFGLRCDVVTTSPLGGLGSGDSMLRQVYQKTISNKNGLRHAYWALVVSYRTANGPRQRVVPWL